MENYRLASTTLRRISGSRFTLRYPMHPHVTPQLYTQPLLVASAHQPRPAVFETGEPACGSWPTLPFPKMGGNLERHPYHILNHDIVTHVNYSHLWTISMCTRHTLNSDGCRGPTDHINKGGGFQTFLFEGSLCLVSLGTILWSVQKQAASNRSLKDTTADDNNPSSPDILCTILLLH